jgi:hypothetical protein
VTGHPLKIRYASAVAATTSLDWGLVKVTPTP